MTQTDSVSPLWKAYEATKTALKALEALPTNADTIDRRYVQRHKRRFHKSIEEFEARFPGYQRQDYLESQIGLP